MNEEFIRQELNQQGANVNHFMVKEFMTVGSDAIAQDTTNNVKTVTQEAAHEKLANKFNKQLFKTVMTASIAQ